MFSKDQAIGVVFDSASDTNEVDLKVRKQLVKFDDYPSLFNKMTEGSNLRVSLLDKMVWHHYKHRLPNWEVVEYPPSEFSLEGVGYSIFLPENFEYEEAFRKTIFSLHESGHIKNLRQMYEH